MNIPVDGKGKSYTATWAAPLQATSVDTSSSPNNALPRMNGIPTFSSYHAFEVLKANVARPEAKPGRAPLAKKAVDPQALAVSPLTSSKAEHILASLTQPKIAVITDAFLQTNGVTRTQDDLNDHFRTAPKYGDWDLSWLTPYDFPSIELKSPWQTDNVRYAWATKNAIHRLFEMHRGAIGQIKATRRHAFDRVHINTEQSVGWAVKEYCLANGIPHTTAYHTNWDQGFDEMVPFVAKLPRVRNALLEKYIYDFHRTSDAVLCVAGMIPKLIEMGIPRERIVEWTHGVNLKAFSPSFRDEKTYAGLKKPVALYVARCSPEKNVPALMQLKEAGWPGSIVFVGDGLSLESYKKQFPEITFVGRKSGEDLSRHFASADLFVQPSLFETWGCTTVEAMASGLPVVALDAPAHHQVIGKSGVGIISDNVGTAAMQMLERINTPDKKREMQQRARPRMPPSSPSVSRSTPW